MTYKTPEGRAWVRIAQRFDAGKEGKGLCWAAESQNLEPIRLAAYFSETETGDVIHLFEPDESFVMYYWPTVYEGNPDQTQRVYAALFIAAMCETGDAYPNRRTR